MKLVRVLYTKHLKTCALALLIFAAFAALAPENDGYLLSATSGSPFRSDRVKISYYPVSGGTLSELRESVAKSGPIDPEGMRRSARVEWDVRWSWPLEVAQEPTEPKARFEKVKCEIEIVVSFPRWVEQDSSRDPQLRQQWEAFESALAKHEQRHIELALDSFEEPCKQIRRAYAHDPNLSIRQAHKIGQRELARIRAMDRDYDLKTDHGKTEGARL